MARIGLRKSVHGRSVSEGKEKSERSFVASSAVQANKLAGLLRAAIWFLLCPKPY
jgi:hypothetical protein